MRKLLFTGASGFLGDNIYPALSKIYSIETLGLSDEDTYKIDLSSKIPELDYNYEVVLHAAGKAHSNPKTSEEENQFFKINLEGTKNLCIALEKSMPPKALIFISTVAVYGIDTGENIDENYPLKGSTPYALSKIQAELFLINWCSMNNVVLGILRPSLIAGMNPIGNLGAMIKGINSGKYLRIGKGSAHKSILMAEDIVNLISNISKVGGIYNVCDNHHPSFAELEELIAKQLNRKKPRSIPYLLAKILAFIGDLLGNHFPINTSKLDKIVKPLTFSNEKAKRILQWEPLDVLNNFKI